MRYSELNEELKEKYGQEFLDLCEKHNIDPIEDEGALLLVEIGNGEYGWIYNDHYEWI